MKRVYSLYIAFILPILFIQLLAAEGNDDFEKDFSEQLKEGYRLLDFNLYSADSLAKGIYMNAVKQGESVVEAKALMLQAEVRFQKGDFAKSLQLNRRAKQLMAEREEPLVMKNLSESMAKCHSALGNNEQAGLSLLEATRWTKMTKDEELFVKTASKTINSFIQYGAFDQALSLCDELIAFQSKSDYKVAVSDRKGYVYQQLGDTEKAFFYLEEAMSKEIPFEELRERIIKSVKATRAMLELGSPARAYTHFQAFESNAEGYESDAILKDFYMLKGDLLLALGRKSEAIPAFEKSIEFHEQLLYQKFNTLEDDTESAKELEELETELEELNSELTGFLNNANGKFWVYVFVIICSVLLLFTACFFVIKQRRINRSLIKKNKLIMERRAQVQSGIELAEQIQKGMLHSERDLQKHLADSFILNRPKDVVSGDLYWFEEVDNKLILACIDCTGHGIPGAFMSVIAHEKMNQTVLEKGITEANKIIEEINISIYEAFDTGSADQSVTDGMDIALCVYDKATKDLTFSGAFSSIMVLSNGEVKEYKADTIGIGQHSIADKPFTIQNVEIDAKDCLFLFTDGYLDQFGGEKGKKFNKKNFRELIQKAGRRPMDQAKRIFAETFENWKGEEQQLDDMLVIGLRL